MTREVCVGRRVSFACAILTAFLAGSNSAHAQDVGYGDDVKFVEHAGDLPFAITATDGSELFVADLFSGLFYEYTRSNIALTPDTESAPLGSATYTGLAFNPTDELLYWLVDDGAGPLLVTSTLTGLLETSVELDLEELVLGDEAAVGDFVWNPDTSSFWVADMANDIYFELGTDGAATGEFFEHPYGDNFSGGAFGVGITAVSQAGIHRFDLPVGRTHEGRATRMYRTLGVNQGGLGGEFGISFPFDSTNRLDGWITGVEWVSQGSSCSNPPACTQAGTVFYESEFCLNLSSNELVEAQVINPLTRSVISVSCTANADNSVTLVWDNGGTYNRLVIDRRIFPGTAYTDAVTFLSSQPGGIPESHTIQNLPNGTYEFRLKASTSTTTVEIPPTFCTTTVGPGLLLNSVAHAGSNPLGITAVESEEEIVVVDLDSGFAYRYDKSLVSLGSLENPFGTDLTTGIAWNSDSDTLFWYNDADGLLQETELDGTEIGTTVPLASPFGGAVGDITYNSTSGSFWGVDISHHAYFEFFADGSTGRSFEDFDTQPISYGNGITSVTDPNVVVFEIPSGTRSAGRVTRSQRVLLSGATPSVISEFLLGASTSSGFINGVAFSASGSQDPANKALYVVGNDTNAIYELNLESGVEPIFHRADCNADETVEVSDVTFLLFYLFKSGSSVPSCFDACDSNDDGALSISDVTFLLQYLFESGPEPNPPFDASAYACGIDDQVEAEDNLECLVVPEACE